MATILVSYKNLELICKPNTVALYREGKLGKDKVVIVDEIFKNSKKGDRANTNELQTAFGTTDINKCIDIMLKDGEYQVTAQERQEKMDQKRREIIHFITSNYSDEKGFPLPVTRVEAALTDMKAKIDIGVPTDKLLQPILKKLPEIMKIKKRQGVHGTLRVPHKHVGKATGIVKQNCTISSERYDTDGVIWELNMPSAACDNLLGMLNKMFGGDYQFDIIN